MSTGDEIDFDIVEKQKREIAVYRKALWRIAKWFGEFPPTGIFWDKEGKDPVSYAGCHGSIGERDYMRKVANDAIEEFSTWIEDRKQFNNDDLSKLEEQMIKIPEEFAKKYSESFKKEYSYIDTQCAVVDSEGNHCPGTPANFICSVNGKVECLCYRCYINHVQKSFKKIGAKHAGI